MSLTREPGERRELQSAAVEHEVASSRPVVDLYAEAARGRALRIWDVLAREGPVDDAVIRQLRLLAIERAQDAAWVREVVEGLAAALST
jgi:hypothetical protein